MSKTGHNSGAEEAVFHKHVAAMAAADAVLAEAKAARKKVRQKAKADGIALKDLDRVLVIAEMTTGEQRDYLNTQATYLRWLRSPIGAQLALFPDGSDDDPFADPGEDSGAAEQEIVEGARGAGFLAGISGRPESDCPHDGNTPAGMAWLEAFREGEAKFKGSGDDPDEDEA